MGRYGLTIPLSTVPLLDHASVVGELRALGYTELWSAETDGTDAFTPLVLASQWVPEMALGTAIVPAYTRGPALIAMSAATMANVAPGRFTLGIGSSSNVIVERWNAMDFTKPFQRTRDIVRFLGDALSGEKVTKEYETFAIDGFRLSNPPSQPPKILVAALREGMLTMAGRESDGAIINWLSPQDAGRVSGYVGNDKTIVARIFVCPTTDIQAVRAIGRRMIAAYLNVPVYREFHRWLGREAELGEMWRLWASGDRKGALHAIPDSVVDDLIVSGTPKQCQDRFHEYFAQGVDVAALAVVAVDGDEVGAIRTLGKLT